MLLAAALPIGAGLLLGASYITFAALPPVPVPPENPITESKRVLGKILFFEEQLSTSNVTACASCHVSGSGGTDPRLARNPGLDGILNTPDDKLASPGIVKADALNNFELDPVFGLRPQVTTRAANSNINAAYAPQLFWDGRALSTFTDPQTGQTAIASGGALESQCVNPPVSTVEMAHAGMDWSGIEQKLQRVRALDLATNIPPDVQAVLNTTRSYRDLFRQAFGDDSITAARIAFALATYERTLIADQTPYDSFVAGNPGALTPQQQQGLQAFLSVGPQNASNCTACHVPPLFTDQSFRNLGLRPIAEDEGRQAVTANPANAGQFLVPSLRNVGLQKAFMHNGQFQSVGQVLAFYGGVRNNNPFPQNRDPVLNQVNVPPQIGPLIADFIANGLTDPRVANQTFPFDRPDLSQSPARAADQVTLLPNTGVPGTGGAVPQIVIQAPPMVGNRDFKVGLNGALAGANARLGFSSNPPTSGRIVPQSLFSAQQVGTAGAYAGVATQFWPLVAGQVSAGQVLFAQWFIDDPGAVGGQAVSAAARIPIFCGSAGCPSACSMSDLNGDGVVDDQDFVLFAQAYDAEFVPLASVVADLNADGLVDDADFALFALAYDAMFCS
jgi:cytochrome c peroxidase